MYDYFEECSKVHFENLNFKASVNILLKCISYYDKNDLLSDENFLKLYNRINFILNMYEDKHKIFKPDVHRTLFPHIIKHFDADISKHDLIQSFIENSIEIYIELGQSHNVWPAMLSNILFLISDYQLESAKNKLDEYFKYGPFIESDAYDFAKEIITMCDNKTFSRTNITKLLGISRNRIIMNNIHGIIYKRLINIDSLKMAEIVDKCILDSLL